MPIDALCHTPLVEAGALGYEPRANATVEVGRTNGGGRYCVYDLVHIALFRTDSGANAMTTSDHQIERALRSLLDARGITIREAASATGTSYRTLQNQLLGKAKMPAVTFVRLIAFLGVTPEVVAEGRYNPPLRPIANALKRVFGDLLPSIDDDARLLPPDPQRERSVLDRNAQFLAFALRESIEREMLSAEDLAALSELFEGSK